MLWLATGENFALRPRPLPFGRAIELLDQIPQGLKTVHEAGLIHRDVKPENVLISASGNAPLCDFGIAKLPDEEHTQMGWGMGSRNYMSPEQRESAKHVQATSDVYSVGTLAYRIITGTLPRDGRPRITFVPGMSETLSDLIMDSIQFEPKDRPHKAVSF